jgi:Zn-dependent peptidase ImmA (M78 family)/DNA-binding XRE family transcriptional regulator
LNGRNREAEFSASRLTVARCRRKFTKRQLAKAIGLSPQAITHYEEETRSAPEHAIQQISFVLDFPYSFFCQDDVRLVGAEEPTFRARRSLRADARDKALATGVIATEIISAEFDKQFDFPVVDLPNLANEEPETAARLVRKHWRLGEGPIHNAVHLLESKGIEVFWLEEPTSCLDAFSLWRADKPYVILNQCVKAGDRCRFNCAHELAHLVLHRGERSLDSPTIERQADRFASAFLLPSEPFHRESPKIPLLSRYISLKERWGVSIQAMIRRGYDLGILTRWYYEQAMKDVSTRGWRINEPVTPRPETSMLHQLVFDRLSEQGVKPSSFAQLLHIPLRDVIEVVPVAAAFVPIDELRCLDTGSRPDQRGTDRSQGNLVLRLYD